MQSSVYVPGVSGYKVKFGKDFVEFHCGPQGPVRIGDLDKALSPKTEPQTPAPSLFIVVGGVTLIRDAEVECDMGSKSELVQGWSVKTALLNGRHIVCGIGPQGHASADQVATDAESVADVVRKILREELRPGGLLYRRA
ncbi:hypothetical protein [Pseudomonas cichorii]|uniref:Uncharacterized protein n=1 Tax=Pseudomonas cichorii TaxID=36746 RepID=A0ABQ1DIX9_PSECI|nr:hypothetical protein [Pseudomonas cichorii]QVE15699.1 hypothetical protein KGD89_17635 [Pseudomonas cichorii]GFM90807.1 hypothetical protein PSCICP_07790 [Pseudomonas cichorii]SDN32980.1 hypothetical protein SAMN05216599_101641 [Pseudomonas cichorii]